MSESLDDAIIGTAMRDMMRRGHFNIITIDQILKVTGRRKDDQAYDRLRLLHCVDFSAIPESVMAELGALISKALGVEMIDLANYATAAGYRPPGHVVEAPEHKPGRLIALFTRRPG